MTAARAISPESTSELELTEARALSKSINCCVEVHPDTVEIADEWRVNAMRDIAAGKFPEASCERRHHSIHCLILAGFLSFAIIAFLFALFALAGSRFLYSDFFDRALLKGLDGPCHRTEFVAAFRAGDVGIEVSFRNLTDDMIQFMQRPGDTAGHEEAQDHCTDQRSDTLKAMRPHTSV